MSISNSTDSAAHSPAPKRKSSKTEPPFMRILLLGKSVSENSRVGNLILGRSAFDSEAPPDVVERVGGRLKHRHVTLINSPQLLHTHISDDQITQTVRECVSLSDPGPHVVLLLLQHQQCSAEDQERVEKLQDSFSERLLQHTLVLSTQEPTEPNQILQKIIQKCSNRHFSLQTSSSADHLLQAFEDIERSNEGRHLISGDSQCSTLEKRDTQTHSEKLNVLVCGSDGSLKSSISELILQHTHRRSESVRTDVINVLELPALFNTGLSEEEVMRQTLRCVSLCHPGVHAFLLIIPDAPLNNEDRAEMEEIQKIFSSRINKHIMILIMQNSEHQTAELNEETQAVIQSFGGRHHHFSPETQVSTLMENIEQMLEENRGGVYSTETFLEAQVKKLVKYEKMMKKMNSLETHLLSQGSRVSTEDEVRIVLLGKTGVGKSATGNTILGRKAFTAETSHQPVTKESQRESCEINGRQVTVIDTPGVFDTELTEEEIQREIRHCISMILPGPHVFIIVLSLGQRFTKEEETSVKIIQETFGENSLMFTMVLFTRGDDLKNKSIEEFLGKPGSPLMNLIEACGHRYHVFNNNQPEERTQVSDLLEKIDNMVKANGGSFYSCKMFREMEREKQEQQMKILMDRVRETEEEMKKLEEEKDRMKMMMEKERQKQEKERKRREEELKREIREGEKHQREMKEEIKKLEEEKKRIKMMMEEERQHQEKERKRREEEFREREERYKRLIKEREQKENELIEQIKLERMQKQTSEERLRRKEEKQKSELHKRLQSPVSDQTAGLNVVLLGKTGVGKSSSGNTILGRQTFISKKSVRPVTRDVTVESGSFCELPVTVYDTPGLFDTKLSDEEIQQMINEKVLQKCSSGLCVFLLVIRADRFTEEDRKTVEKIEKILGENNKKNTWILFTRGDKLEEENTTIQEFIEETEELKTLVQKYEHRYHLFNNKKMKMKRTSVQVNALFTKILKRNSDTAAGAENLLRKIAANIEPVSRVSSPPSRRIVLLGISGVGKSAAGNTILGQKEFTSEMRMNSITRECSEAQATVSGRFVSVVDTPGLFDTQMSPEELMKEITRSVYISSPGPHAFLIVFPVNMRFTKQVLQILQMIELLFGEEVLKYSIILFTHGDLLDGEPLEKLIEENCRLRSLVQQCGGRYHVFNNRDEENREQVEDLLQKIDSMIQQNGGGHYTNQMYEDAQRFRQEEEEERQREEEKRKRQEDKQRQEELERVKKETEERLRSEDRLRKQSQNCVCS